MKIHTTFWKYTAICFFAISAGTSCKNDIETIQALTHEVKLPDITGFDIEMMYTDSGILKGKIYASEVYQYMHEENPYYEFPKGMKAVFFDVNGNETAYITAKYAIYYPRKLLWEGRNQVHAESPGEGKSVETEQIFWDQNEKRIYTDKYAKVTNPDGIFIGENGFEAKEDLSRLRMNGYSGKVTVTDTPPEENP
jgi:LPS export ABC transporter protein LptC